MIDEAAAKKEQQAAEYEFGHVADQRGTGEKQSSRDSRDGHPGYSAGRARGAYKYGAAQGGAAHISAEGRRHDIGNPEDLEIAINVGVGAGRNLDAGRVEQKIDDGDEHDGEKIAGERRQRGPGKSLQRAGLPRRDEFGVGLRTEHPAVDLRVTDRGSDQRQNQIRRHECRQTKRPA